jgi:hypothetical protein
MTAASVENSPDLALYKENYEDNIKALYKNTIDDKDNSQTKTRVKNKLD